MIQLSSVVKPPFFTFTSAHFKLFPEQFGYLWLQGFHFWLFSGSECLSESPPPIPPNESSAENGPRSSETANALDRVRELSSIVPIRRARFTILCTRAPSNHSRCPDSSSVGRVGSCCLQVSAAFAKVCLKKEKISALSSCPLIWASMFIIGDMKRNVPYSLFSTH